MSFHPMIDLGCVVADQFPRIGDWERAVSAFLTECEFRGVVAPERKIVVRALLMGYLIVGKQKRAIRDKRGELPC